MKNCLQTLALLAAVSFFAACGNSNESTTTTPMDTLAPETQAPMMGEETPMPTDTVMSDTMQTDSM